MTIKFSDTKELKWHIVIDQLINTSGGENIWIIQVTEKVCKYGLCEL